MKIRHLLTAALLFAAAPAMAQVGVTVHIGDPGYYGRIERVGYPAPRLIHAKPVIVERVRYRDPVYLRVPPGHAKNWRKHCGRYDACARPVYFVEDSWYERVYVPSYRERHHVRHDDHRHDDRHDRHHDHRKHGRDRH